MGKAELSRPWPVPGCGHPSPGMVSEAVGGCLGLLGNIGESWGMLREAGGVERYWVVLGDVEGCKSSFSCVGFKLFDLFDL